MNVKSLLKYVLFGLNKGLSYVDRLFSVDRDENAPPPLFIVGVPRSGTTLMYQIITQQFEVGYFSTVMGYLYGIPNILARVLQRVFTGKSSDEFESKYGNIKGFSSPSEHADYWRLWFAYNDKYGFHVIPEEISHRNYNGLRRSLDSISTILRRPMVFKCLYLDTILGVLAKALPEARFIVVRRDLLLTSQSLYLGRMSQKDPSKWWSVRRPEFIKLLSLPVWQQIVEQVYQTEKLILEDLEKYASGRYIVLNYEDICEQPVASIMVLEEWLAPIGYKSNHNCTMPERFTASKDMVLPEETLSKMKDYLNKLKSQDLIDE